MQNCPNLEMNIWFHVICQMFAKLFAKNVNGGSDKYEIWCVEQLGCAEKKKLKIAFLSDQPIMEQISSCEPILAMPGFKNRQSFPFGLIRCGLQ